MKKNFKNLDLIQRTYQLLFALKKNFLLKETNKGFDKKALLKLSFRQNSMENSP
jgi:hypothetical protein